MVSNQSDRHAQNLIGVPHQRIKDQTVPQSEALQAPHSVRPSPAGGRVRLEPHPQEKPHLKLIGHSQVHFQRQQTGALAKRDQARRPHQKRRQRRLANSAPPQKAHPQSGHVHKQ